MSKKDDRQKQLIEDLEKQNQQVNEQLEDSDFDVIEETSKETLFVEEKQKKKTQGAKVKKAKPKSNKWKKFFYGVGREFTRISWTSKKEMGTSFATVVVVIVFFALIFTGISLLMVLL